MQVSSRTGSDAEYLFVQNFSGRPVQIDLPPSADVLTGETVSGSVQLPVCGVRILKR